MKEARVALLQMFGLLGALSLLLVGAGVLNGNIAYVERGNMTLHITEVEGKKAPLTCETIRYVTIKDELKLVAGHIEGPTRKMTGGFIEGSALVADGFIPRRWGTAYDDYRLYEGKNQVTTFCGFLHF